MSFFHVEDDAWSDSFRSSQARLNSQLQAFIDDVKAGKRDAMTVVKTLQTAGCPEQTATWAKLQHELQDAGIALELSALERDSIMSILRQAAEQHNLLEIAESKQNDSTDTPASTATSGAVTSEAVTKHPKPRHNHFFPRTPPSYKEVLTEDLPIPVIPDLQDVDDSSKQAVPREDFPIPMGTEPPVLSDDFDKQVMPADINIPIPMVTASTSQSQNEAASDNGSSASPSRSTPSIARGKKPSLMSRMKYKMSSSKEGFTKLVEMGELSSIKFALDRGADVNSTDKEEKSALVIAVSLGLEDVVSLLLEYGAKIDEVGTYGETALSVAASRGYDDIVQLLLASGAAPDGPRNLRRTALAQAGICGSLSITKMLLDWGADVNAVNATGNTALVCAAFSGHPEIVQLLLENGAEVDKAGQTRQTPLFKAVSRGAKQCAKLLLVFGADPHKKDVAALSPMDLAAQLGRTEILNLFYDSGFGFRHYVDPESAFLDPPPPWTR